jgi:osmoprotectant transport system permease protein
VIIAVIALAFAADPPTIRVGSKAFTEGVILGEIATQQLSSTGARVTHRSQLGGTRIVFEALKSGEIDVYAEYTGTLREEIYRGANDLDTALAQDGLAMTAPLGFEDSYGIAMRASTANQAHVARISDLAAHPELQVAVSNEFLDRKDGWRGLAERYALAFTPRGMDHDVAYRALLDGKIDVVDCYTTDAEITRDELVVLADDRAWFPRYDAVYVYRKGTALDALHALAGSIDAATMSAMNARVRFDHASERDVAAAFLSKRDSASPSSIAHNPSAAESRLDRIERRTLEHVILVGAALALSIAIGLPLGIVAARVRRLGRAVLAVTGVVQTIPSLALLVLFVPLVGIGAVPAIIAMVLYGLLPIVRNTHAGITGIAPPLVESAFALALSSRTRLFRIELPLASRSILAGIQTSATIAVGTATIGALVGAGGYGQSILTGVRLADVGLVLEGALPAAAMAIVLQLLFDRIKPAA